MNKTLDLINNRKSIRKFNDKKISIEGLKKAVAKTGYQIEMVM